MFHKIAQTKHNVALKGSGVKRLRDRLAKEFPNAELDMLIPPKSTVAHVKVETPQQTVVNVYTIDKQPRFFETDQGQLVPTVYTLWIVRDLLPYFTTHKNVMPFLANGADLMLAGVVPTGTGLSMYGHYKANQLVAVNFVTNYAAAGVGYLDKASDELYMRGGKGVAVRMLHLYGDKLWNLEPTKVLNLPNFAPAALTADDFPALGETQPRTKEPSSYAGVVESVSQLELQEQDGDVAKENVEEAPADDPLISPEDELKLAFLCAIKKHGKSLQLPMLTSNFFRNYVLPETEGTIELKKTKYKKLSAFLEDMQNQGFVKVREEAKGVDKIISIDFTHPELLSLIVDVEKPKTAANGSGAPDAQQQPLFKTELTELYTVTDETASFFAKVFLKRGEGIAATQLKKIVREYLNTQRLPPAGADKRIPLDETLRVICGCEKATPSDICNALRNKMTHSFQMCTPKDNLTNKPRIQMSLANRAGNKKVTLVSNLENYGIILAEFIKLCKTGAAASTTIVKLPHQNSEQLQIQGNQVQFIFKLLTETYKVPAQCILGLELQKPPKKKSKSKK